MASETPGTPRRSGRPERPAFLGVIALLSLGAVLSPALLYAYSPRDDGTESPSNEVNVVIGGADLEETFRVRRQQASAELESAMAQATETAATLPPEVLASDSGRALVDAMEEAEVLVAQPGEVSGVEVLAQRNVMEQALRDATWKETEYAALLTDLTDLFAGRRGAVAAVDVQTGGVVVSFNADQVFTAASTYKIFTAYSMIQAVESGEMTWGSPLAGTTMERCFDRMLTYSDNPCPLAWFRNAGYDRVQKQARDLGAVNTSIRQGGLNTTALDLATALRALAATNAISDPSRERMFGLMESQEDREGIPAAIEPDHGVVADKVGYLNALLHDAAIISTDKGDYALVVLTENASWEIIAKAATLVYDYL